MLNSSEAALQTAIALWCNAIARWYAAVPLVGPTYLSGGVFDRSPDGRLTFVGPYANRAGDGLISLALAFGRIVSDPALHLEGPVFGQRKMNMTIVHHRSTLRSEKSEQMNHD
jgi:hypothetical protein